MSWASVASGICSHGDSSRPCPVPPQAWTRTPVTWSQCGRTPPPGISPTAPVTGLTYQEAVALAVEIGGRLPTSVEWEWMAIGPSHRRYPWGPLGRRGVDTGAGEPSRLPSWPTYFSRSSSGWRYSGRAPRRRGQRVGVDLYPGHRQRIDHSRRLLQFAATLRSREVPQRRAE